MRFFRFLNNVKNSTSYNPPQSVPVTSRISCSLVHEVPSPGSIIAMAEYRHLVIVMLGGDADLPLGGPDNISLCTLIIQHLVI